MERADLIEEEALNHLFNMGMPFLINLESTTKNVDIKTNTLLKMCDKLFQWDYPQEMEVSNV